ncbi:hypothetical protein F0919_17830 [Taibaiella lutea]|uniref:Uncharacterized protein n=1 Tax=Taibaiella lutea TaxID=2608001 RepID=A0A5M6CC58_9BACT|nr:hypothetical protein [Taibaiella lutea]KAA5532641.1 hypothetical protein F0919_17830 [Taibaiella lutea]
MNLKMWQWWLKQSRTNQLIIVIAFVAFSSSAFLVREGKRKDGKISEQDITIGNLTKANIECEQRNGQQAKEILESQLKDEKERSRKSDSMYYAITAAKVAVKKASKK